MSSNREETAWWLHVICGTLDIIREFQPVFPLHAVLIVNDASTGPYFIQSKARMNSTNVC